MEPGTIRQIKKPSVSQLLALLDKPALLNWANKQGLKGIDISKERGKWLSAGTSFHKQIELFYLEKKPFESLEVQSLFEDFLKDKTIIDFEKKIETDFFIGRYDSKLIYNNKKYIIDFKSSNGIYFENKLQLAAYGMAEDCDGYAIVNIPSFTWQEVVIEDKKHYENILKSLSLIYSSKQLLNAN